MNVRFGNSAKQLETKHIFLWSPCGRNPCFHWCTDIFFLRRNVVSPEHKRTKVVQSPSFICAGECTFLSLCFLVGKKKQCMLTFFLSVMHFSIYCRNIHPGVFETWSRECTGYLQRIKCQTASVSSFVCLLNVPRRDATKYQGVRRWVRRARTSEKSLGKATVYVLLFNSKYLYKKKNFSCKQINCSDIFMHFTVFCTIKSSVRNMNVTSEKSLIVRILYWFIERRARALEASLHSYILALLFFFFFKSAFVWLASDWAAQLEFLSFSKQFLWTIS